MLAPRLTPAVADLFPTRYAALAHAMRHADRLSQEFCRALPIVAPLSMRAYRIASTKTHRRGRSLLAQSFIDRSAQVRPDHQPDKTPLLGRVRSDPGWAFS